MRPPHVAISLVFSTLSCVVASAQSPLDAIAEVRSGSKTEKQLHDDACGDGDAIAFVRWLECRQLVVRKSFESDKDAAMPAALAFESGSKEHDYYNVDIALRINKRQLGSSWIVYPVLEAHRSTQTANKVNNKSGALKLEFSPFKGDIAGSDLLPVGESTGLRPYFLFDAKALRDSQNSQSVGNFNAQVALKSIGQVRFGPGRPLRCGSILHCFRYRPFIGLEHFHNLVVGPEDARTRFSGNLGVVRLSIEAYPFANMSFRTVELLAQGEYRNRLSSHETVPDKAYLWSAQVNLYLDKAQSIAIGFDYEDGRGPDSNFVAANRYGLSLKFKFSE